MVWPSPIGYSIVLPLPIVKKWGISILKQPFYCQYLGFFSREKLSEDLANLFLKKLSEHFIYISSYSFNPDNTEVLGNLLNQFSDFLPRTFQTHWLPLSKSYPALYSGYHRDKRKNLRRSTNKEWNIQLSENPIPLLALFQSNHAAKIPGGVADSAYHLLQQLHKELLNRNLCSLFYAVKDSSIHAGCLIVTEGNRSIYLFNAADPTGRAGNARTLILDHYFRSREGSLTVFDFESPPHTGICSNYLGYGSEEVTFYSIRKNKLPFPLRKWQENRIQKSTTRR
jgi:hypothetical protein